jgi:hypothetical protein
MTDDDLIDLVDPLLGVIMLKVDEDVGDAMTLLIMCLAKLELSTEPNSDREDFYNRILRSLRMLLEEDYGWPLSR